MTDPSEVAWDAALAEQIKAAEDRDGVPMIVAVHDARPGRRIDVRDPQTLADGAGFASQLDAYLPLVAADAAREDETDPTGARPLIRTLAVVAHLHMSPGRPGRDA